MQKRYGVFEKKMVEKKSREDYFVIQQPAFSDGGQYEQALKLTEALPNNLPSISAFHQVIDSIITTNRPVTTLRENGDFRKAIFGEKGF